MGVSTWYQAYSATFGRVQEVKQIAQFVQDAFTSVGQTQYLNASYNRYVDAALDIEPALSNEVSAISLARWFVVSVHLEKANHAETRGYYTTTAKIAERLLVQDNARFIGGMSRSDRMAVVKIGELAASKARGY